MKKRSLLIGLSLLTCAFPVAYADSHHDDEHEHTALEDQMSDMNKAWRSIRRQIKDPSKNKSTLEMVAKVKKGATKSLELTPMLAEEKSGAEKEKFIASYQKAMKRMIGLVGDLENALKAGDNAKAEEIVGKINDARSKGHEDFQPEDY